MQTYRNLSGTSGVVRYELAEDAITVEFKKGKCIPTLKKVRD